MIIEFLGPAHMTRESRRESLPAGVVAGLAWTEMGRGYHGNGAGFSLYWFTGEK